MSDHDNTTAEQIEGRETVCDDVLELGELRERKPACDDVLELCNLRDTRGGPGSLLDWLNGLVLT